MHHLLTQSVEPSAPCALCPQADMATTAERRQTPPIGNMHEWFSIPARA